MSSPQNLDPKTRFDYQFRHSVSNITSQIQSLGSLSSSPSIGELGDAIQHILASISQLSTSVSDAGADNTLPAHDQRVYADTVKSLRDQLGEMRAKVEPNKGKRFTFKRRTPASQQSTTDSRKLGSVGNTDQPTTGTAKVEEEETSKTQDYNAELSASPPQRPGTSTESGRLVRRPSFSSARSITISGHSNLHIILPASASHATSAGQLTELKKCVVDISTPTAREGGTPFASLVLKDIDHCLIVAGHVDGAVHITGVSDSVIVVVARQVRIHECDNVDVYCWVASHPIIEDCEGMRFAPCPKEFLEDTGKEENELWKKVDDFKWLKHGQSSPHWKVLPEEERVGFREEDKEGDGKGKGGVEGKVWRRIVSGDGGRLVREDILRKVGVLKK
ncbi:tubulin binding cofactor C-domain-containing protein [Cladorrhinum sp. PSN259]|nr:tubulin binding cofactor C-domain-containing protein [Cladorrhinum sp. PSN259]